jgi:tetratricopeptide (TPR) repeat protein
MGKRIDGDKKERDRKVKKEQAVAHEGDKFWEPLFAEAVRLHQRGIEGDKGAVRKAYKLLKKIRNMNPQNNLIEAYYGSVTTLLGRDASDLMEKFQKAMSGLKILDEVVSKEPDNIEIHTIRAYVCYNLPEVYFHRTSTAIEDFNYLISRYDQNPNVFTQEFYWKLLYDLGVAYKRLERHDEAKSTWEKLLSQTTDPKYQELLTQEGVKEPDFPLEASRNDTQPADMKKEEIPEEGLNLYHLALSGDKQAAKKAFDFFSKALERDPANPLLKACYADCMSLTGMSESDSFEMFGNAIKAMKIFDSVVNANPDNTKIRLMRAFHSYRLPEAFFRRTTTAIEDFEYLVQRYENDPSILSTDTYWQLLYELGMAYKRMEMEKEAKSVWQKLLSLQPDPKYKELIDAHKTDYLFSYSVLPISFKDKKAIYKEGKRLHELGVAGNKQAVQMAHDLWQKAHEKYPGDSVIKAYYGSCLALMGRDSTDPKTIFSNTFRGIKLINEAVEDDSKNVDVRLVRAYLLYSLPESMFPMTEKAIEDFEYIKMVYENKKGEKEKKGQKSQKGQKSAKGKKGKKDKMVYEKKRGAKGAKGAKDKKEKVIPEELYHQILYDLGKAYQRTGEGWKTHAVWSQLPQQSSNPKYQSLLNERV